MANEKAVLLSIRSPWCVEIANGRKTVEVRKTKPKLEPPFKCYIYCTNAWPYLVIGDVFRGDWCTEHTLLSGYGRKEAEEIWDVFNGNVIGEFICDEIIDHCESTNADIAVRQGRIEREYLDEYANGKELYGWHISDLELYDEPMPLSELNIKQAPQSWCYI